MPRQFSSVKEGGFLPPSSVPRYFAFLVFFVSLPPLVLFNTLPEDQYLILPVLLCSLLCCISALFQSELEFSVTKFSIFAFLLALFLFLQVSWSDWPWMSLWLAWCFALLPLGFLAGFYLKDYVGYFFVSLVILTLFNSVFVIAQGVVYPDVRPSGFLDDANLSANIICIGLLVLSFFYFKFDRSLLLIFVFFFWVGLFFTQSRGALVALFVSFGVLCILFVLSFGKKSYRRILTLLVIAASAYLMVSVLLDGVLSEAISPYSRPGSMEGRFDIWRSAWLLFMETPYIGSGLGTFFLRYPPVRAMSETTTTGHFAHSDLLQLALETGVLGVILVLVLPLAFSYLLFKNVLLGKKDNIRFDVSALTFSVLLLVGVHGVVNFILYHPFVASTLGVFLGVGLKNLTGKSDAPLLYVSNKLWLLPGVALLVASIVSLGFDYKSKSVMAEIEVQPESFNLQSNRYYDLMFYELFSPLNVSIKNYLTKAEMTSAIGLVGSDVGMHFRRQIIDRIDRNLYYMNPNCVQLTDRARLVWFDDKHAAVDSLLKLTSRLPNCFQAIIVLSNAYASLEDYDSAEIVLNEGIKRFPLRELTGEQALALLEQLVRVLESDGREDEANAVQLYINDFASRLHGYLQGTTENVPPELH